MQGANDVCWKGHSCPAKDARVNRLACLLHTRKSLHTQCSDLHEEELGQQFCYCVMGFVGGLNALPLPLSLSLPLYLSLSLCCLSLFTERHPSDGADSMDHLYLSVVCLSLFTELVMGLTAWTCNHTTLQPPVLSLHCHCH